jgi:hypothetical protein
MVSAMFIWLGSGRARRRKVEHSGLTLDRAAKAGLPVPDGAILLDEFFQICLQEQLVMMTDDGVVVPDAELLHNTLLYSVHLPRFIRPVVLRPCLPADLCPEPPFAGPSLDTKPVDIVDAQAVIEMLSGVWSSIARHSSANRADVLMLENVVSAATGQAITSSGEVADQVYVRAGEATFGARLELPQLTGWRIPEQVHPPYVRRLQMLLRGVRRTFGEGRWALEWADDGSVCYLIDLSPCP